MKYVVVYHTGEYSDFHTENVFACDTKEQADSLAEDFNNRLKRFGLHRDQEDEPEFARNHPDRYANVRRQEEAWRKETASVLGQLYIDYTGAWFDVDEVREIHDRPRGYKEPEDSE